MDGSSPSIDGHVQLLEAIEDLGDLVEGLGLEQSLPLLRRGER